MKIAFIGVGGIAGNYRSSLRKLEYPIAAVCDIDRERAEQIAQEESATAYTDHKELLANEKPDVVFVCIPPGAHETQVADAAEARAALFIAKPVALRMDTARRALESIAKAGVINQVGYMARYSDMTEKARELIGERKLAMAIGRFICRMSPSHPWWGKFAVSGGQMHEQTTHVFDYLRYFLGEAEEVQAFGIRDVSDGIADFEECTVCNLRFTGGAVGSINSTCVSRGEDNFSTEFIGDNFYLKAIMGSSLRGSVDGQEIDFKGEESGFFRQVEQFIAAIGSNDQGLVRSDYEDGLKTLAVTLAANRSLETGKVENVTI